MKTIRTLAAILPLALSAIGAAILVPAPARAHCDGLDGPVVRAARQALGTGDPNPVLIWVKKTDEPQIRSAFEHALKVRKLGPAAQDLADTYFFETLVRVHRAGEGAAFTGLKPAGRDLGPAIPAADQALKSGDPTALAKLLSEKMRAGLLENYRKVMAAKSFPERDVRAGREYVEAYVRYIHYVEGVYQRATSRVSGHYPEGAPASHDDK